jgi:hypothetical protein
VIIEGDPDVLPWEKKAQNIKTLVEMCKSTDKILFSSGIGVPLLVNFCAIGEKKLHVINGNEKGSLLSEIHQFKSPAVVKKLTPHSVFLDQTTGDFYSFDESDMKWKATGNVGLHYRGLGHTDVPGK